MMLDFWLAAGLLLLVAFGMLLVPALSMRKRLETVDRAGVNVGLYEERLAQLRAEHAEGVLDAAQLHQGETEAARELLADTERSETSGERGRRWLPLCAAVVVPLLALGLYWLVGASGKVELARELAQAPTSLEDMTQRLERAVAAQPESVEGLYFLARTYMAQNRAGEAAGLFERAAALSNRPPELLGQWAQARFFANGKHWDEQIQALVDEALKADPKEPTSLGLLGISAFEGQRYQEAIDYWQRLLAELPAQDTSRQALQGGIDRARERLGQTPAATEAPAAQLTVRVSLDPALRGKVQDSDTVFVFARAVSGPPMPLAVKRLKVSDLPAEVTLSDADAMMPSLKLSTVSQVQLMARISRAGEPTRGEWVARGEPLAKGTHGVQTLVIDRPDS